MTTHTCANGGALTTCPVAYCDGFHGPDTAGTIHATTVRETAGIVFTVVQIRQDDGHLSSPRVLLYGPDRNRVDSLNPQNAAVAGELFTAHTNGGDIREAGHALTAAAALAERISALSRETP